MHLLNKFKAYKRKSSDYNAFRRLKKPHSTPLQSHNNTKTIIHQPGFLSQGNQNSHRKALLCKPCLLHPSTHPTTPWVLINFGSKAPTQTADILFCAPCHGTEPWVRRQSIRSSADCEHTRYHQPLIPGTEGACSNTNHPSSVPYPLLSGRSHLSRAWQRPWCRCFTSQHSSSISSSAISLSQANQENSLQFLSKYF